MLYCRHSFTAYFPGISEDYNQPAKPYENDRLYKMEQKQRSYERNMRKWDRERRVKAAAGLDTTKEDYWYKYNKMRLKELVDASKGRLKRDYSAEKIGGTKGRPYKPVRIPKRRVSSSPSYSSLGEIDPKKYGDPENLNTTKTIFTDERAMHIKERHPDIYDLVVKHAKDILEDPDATYLEEGREDTVWAVKQIESDSGKSVQMVVKLSQGQENEGKYNSVITAYTIRSRRIENKAKNGKLKLLYKK